MTKEGRRKQLGWRRSAPFVAMLATLAFAGGGQALAPAPAAALQIEACAQPESRLCAPPDSGPIFGADPTGPDQGSGSVGGLPGATGNSAAPPPPPGFSSWDKVDSDGVPTWMAGNPRLRAQAYRHLCDAIGDRTFFIEESIEAVNDILQGLDDPPVDRAAQLKYAQVKKTKLKRQLQRINDQWDSHNCTELGF